MRMNYKNNCHIQLRRKSINRNFYRPLVSDNLEKYKNSINRESRNYIKFNKHKDEFCNNLTEEDCFFNKKKFEFQDNNNKFNKTINSPIQNTINYREYNQTINSSRGNSINYKRYNKPIYESRENSTNYKRYNKPIYESRENSINYKIYNKAICESRQFTNNNYMYKYKKIYAKKFIFNNSNDKMKKNENNNSENKYNIKEKKIISKNIINNIYNKDKENSCTKFQDYNRRSLNKQYYIQNIKVQRNNENKINENNNIQKIKNEPFASNKHHLFKSRSGVIQLVKYQRKSNKYTYNHDFHDKSSKDKIRNIKLGNKKVNIKIKENKDEEQKHETKYKNKYENKNNQYENKNNQYENKNNKYENKNNKYENKNNKIKYINKYKIEKLLSERLKISKIIKIQKFWRGYQGKKNIQQYYAFKSLFNLFKKKLLIEIIKKKKNKLLEIFFYRWIWNTYNNCLNNENILYYEGNNDFLLKFNFIKNNKSIRIECLNTKIINNIKEMYSESYDIKDLFNFKEYPENKDIIKIFNNLFDNNGIKGEFDNNQNEFKLKIIFNNKTNTFILTKNICNDDDFIRKNLEKKIRQEKDYGIII